MRFVFAAVMTAFLICPGIPAFAAETVPSFTNLPSFPSSPGGFGYSISAAALGDGRFILWDGDAIHIETAPGSDTFSVVATGYGGDPGFIAVAPDGHTCLLGAGYSGNLYSFDAAAPVSDGAIVANTPHYSGVYLTNDKVLLDAAIDMGGWVFVAQLSILDLGQQPPVAREVVSGKGGASAFVCLDPMRQFAFATDGLTGETRRFAVADLLQAFAADTPLAWADGALLGTYTANGPGACTDDYTLLFGSFTGVVQFAYANSIDVTAPGSFSRTATTDPSGTGVLSYTVAYSAATDRILAVGTDYSGFPPTISGWIADAPKSVPVGSPLCLVVLMAALSAVSLYRFMNRRMA